MSNHVCVVDGKINRLCPVPQARAAGVEPDVRMKSVLLEPGPDTKSQVVVRRVVDGALSAIPRSNRNNLLWAVMAMPHRDLASENEVSHAIMALRRSERMVLNCLRSTHGRVPGIRQR